MVTTLSLSSFKEILGGKCHYSIVCLFLCLILYGVQSSPTPDNPGFVEFTVILLLVMSVGASGLLNALRNSRHVSATSIFFLFGAFVPFIIGMINGNAYSIMVRDTVALILFCLPLFLIPLCQKYKHGFTALVLGSLFVALFFSLRVLFVDLPLMKETNELLYLANSPLVLFYSIVLIGLFYQCLLQRFYFRSIACLLLASVMVLSMVQDVQRATLLAVIVSLGFIVAFHFIKSPQRSFLPLIICAALLLVFGSVISDIFLLIEYKTSLVGVNSRAHELAAVWHEIGQNPYTALFGLGWGSQFASPALGGLQASFTHSFLSYMLLKTGLLGFAVALGYCFYFGRHIIHIFFKNSLVGIALFWAFVIPVFLYASYKSFDFGLVLTLIVAFSIYEKTLSSDYQSRLPSA